MFLLEYTEDAVTDLATIVAETMPSGPEQALPVFVIGGFAKGSIDSQSLQKENVGFGMCMKTIKVHQDPLTAAHCCAMLTHAYEEALGI